MSPSGGRLDCFKAYDVRGRVPDELNEDIAEEIGRAYARLVSPRTVVVGRDMRLTGPSLSAALCRGLTSMGVDVVDIGMVGTEQVYFSTFALAVEGGIMVTASHNPADYNGMKFVREDAYPISADTGLKEMEATVAHAISTGTIGTEAIGPVPGASSSLDRADRSPGTGGRARSGAVERMDINHDYLTHLLSYVNPAELRPLHVVANCGNGMAGPILDLLAPHLPFRFTVLHEEPDGSFPHGVPNPLLPENRVETTATVRAAGADLGLAWDGDFDRCFFFDETGEFIEGYYLVGLLAQHALAQAPGSAIVHDPRLVWNTLEMVNQSGGRPVQSKSGHAFIKERMRQVDAAYGGEMSAHHYFRDFHYADSGMIPWLLVTAIMSSTGKKLSELVGERMRRFPASGEINREVHDPPATIARVRRRYEPQALKVDETDGISLEFSDWRFNLRSSNTEPVIRLNVETRGNTELLREKTAELLNVIDQGD